MKNGGKKVKAAVAALTVILACIAAVAACAPEAHAPDVTEVTPLPQAQLRAVSPETAGPDEPVEPEQTEVRTEEELIDYCMGVTAKTVEAADRIPAFETTEDIFISIFSPKGGGFPREGYPREDDYRNLFLRGMLHTADWNIAMVKNEAGQPGEIWRVVLTWPEEANEEFEVSYGFSNPIRNAAFLFDAQSLEPLYVEFDIWSSQGDEIYIHRRELYRDSIAALSV